MGMQYTSNLGKVKSAFKQQAKAALEIIGGKAETYAKQLAAVDTGRMRASITHQVSGSEAVVIGTNVEYAPYVELGTKRMKARPFIRPAVEGHTPEYKAILEQQLRS